MLRQCNKGTQMGSLQTVKKVRNRQNRFTIQWIFALWILFAKVEDFKLYGLKTSLLRKDFDLLRNSRPTVPMYADERELLVFRTFSQSVSVPKRVFRHAESKIAKSEFVFFILQFWPLRRVIEREREPISALRAAAFAAVALRNASLRLGVTVPFHTRIS